ncbi:hypothetical protein SAMN05216368_10219 [Cryobacterium flavum]|uniref:Uncharacterized protein n=1 Tax=Cryobacterium flavum TaxID=1424659 RepID=A0A4R8VDV2_9MICO|nr:hypothetical protein [Cryobacterium flavum]TFB81239.1 hypothetical protein E3O21_05190 [Cryobacterium flavum]SDM69083.1 hypothetical protein SAMN05216368_10219 [Cryobacterium flavum]
MTNSELHSLSVGELIDTYSGILDELRQRGLIRTKNAPVVDLAEYAASIAYDGILEKDSAKSYDLLAGDGRRVQVKVRNVVADTSPSQIFSAIRSDGYDVCLFVLVIDNWVTLAKEWSPADVKVHGRYQAHTNSVVVQVGTVMVNGTDVTPMLQSAWTDMRAIVATADDV